MYGKIKTFKSVRYEHMMLNSSYIQVIQYIIQVIPNIYVSYYINFTNFPIFFQQKTYLFFILEIIDKLLNSNIINLKIKIHKSDLIKYNYDLINYIKNFIKNIHKFHKKNINR